MDNSGWSGLTRGEYSRICALRGDALYQEFINSSSSTMAFKKEADYTPVSTWDIYKLEAYRCWVRGDTGIARVLDSLIVPHKAAARKEKFRTRILVIVGILLFGWLIGAENIGFIILAVIGFAIVGFFKGNRNYPEGYCTGDGPGSSGM